jgi:hypothetical protein
MDGRIRVWKIEMIGVANSTRNASIHSANEMLDSKWKTKSSPINIHRRNEPLMALGSLPG